MSAYSGFSSFSEGVECELSVRKLGSASVIGLNAGYLYYRTSIYGYYEIEIDGIATDIKRAGGAMLLLDLSGLTAGSHTVRVRQICSPYYPNPLLEPSDWSEPYVFIK